MGAVLIAGGSTQCLLLTESPNVRPDVKLSVPTEMRKGTMVTFQATSSDDHGPPRVDWYLRDSAGRPCPATIAEATAEPEAMRTTGASYPWTATEGAFCLWVVATDDRGAQAHDGRAFRVENQAPVARLAMVAPTARGTGIMPVGGVVAVPLYSEVRLSGVGSEDDDPVAQLQYRWTVTPPPGAQAPAPCLDLEGRPVPDGADLCRRLNAAGEYRFVLEVDDGAARSSVEMRLMAEPDAPPCIEQTEPPHDLARGESGLPPLIPTSFASPYTFRVVEVRDDGDPFPTASGVVTGSFSWRYRMAGDKIFTRITDTTQSAFSFEANRYRPGDEVEVSLEYRDRRPLQASPCLETAADQCESPPQSRCFQRVSWRLRFIQ
jgi:hypothetical protein